MASSGGGTATVPMQPQTTQSQQAGGPFIQYSNPGSRALYTASSVAFGGQVTQPVPSVAGFLRKIRPIITAAGGTGAVAVAPADAPYHCISLVQLKDAFGNPLIIASGYSAFKLLPMFSGQFGLLYTADPANLNSFSAVATTGNFQFAGALPLEFAKGIGVVSGADASLLPSLTWNLAPSSVVYSVLPTTVPTVTLDVEADFYWLATPSSILPPGLGTTQQWIEVAANPPIGSNSSLRVQLSRVGGYVTTIVLIMRDSTGARIDSWPSRVQLYIDGVPVLDDPIAKVYDDMQIAFGSGGGWTRPVGVIAYTRKTSLSQISLGLLDTGETLLSTNPGTQIEVAGSPWGAVTNAPAQLTALIGTVVPNSQLVTGLPEI